MTREDAIKFVDDYLQMNEDRDLAGAQACWAPNNFKMIFPGGVEFSSFSDLLDWAKPRYKWVRKNRDVYSVEIGDETVVVSRGRIYGENLHGVPFEGIRYVDIFTIKDGLLIEQAVWNDFGESDVLTRTTA